MVIERFERLPPTGEPNFDRAVQNTKEVIRRKPPGKEFLLGLISTMDPDCEIFHKNYVKPKVNRYADDDEELDDEGVMNVDNWFSDLPLAKQSKKSHGIKFGSSKAQEKQKLKRMQMQKAMIESKLDAQKQKVEQLLVESDEHAEVEPV